MINGLIELLRPVAGWILPLVFIGFFVATAIAVRWARHHAVRRTYLAGFLLALIVFQTVMPLYITPFMQWHKFSEPRPVESSSHEFRVVDANGTEIKLDRKATLDFDGISPEIAGRTIEEYDNETRKTVVAWLLASAQQYRAKLERGQPTRGSLPTDIREAPDRLHRFPAHSFSGWTVSDVDELEAFVGIRIYEVNTTTSPDGTEIVEESETLVYEAYPDPTDPTEEYDVR